MSDMFEDDVQAGNAHDYTVSEISGAVKRVIEGEFGRIRVRGEIGRISRPASGHLYFNLKEEGASLDAVAWKVTAARLKTRPEEGMEVVASGRLTTFPGQSKYQLIVEEIRPAGIGALMAMLDKRRRALEAEGLFAAERKRPLPYLPEVIGVITSPSGAVIRDILHRLRDRFPRQVLIWPVAVQGERCAPEVARAIAGFNALGPGGAVPRPDLLIVARGGGSIEDLWAFNEEIVVRAAAASAIPLISAVGHETDTTLLDHAADRRAPTPRAAAEMAVPVRLDLLAWAAEQGARLGRALSQGLGAKRQRARDLARALPRPAVLTEGARQRLDRAETRLGAALRHAAQARRVRLSDRAGSLRPALLARLLAEAGRRLGASAARLQPGLLARDQARQRRDLDRLVQRLGAAASGRLDRQRRALDGLDRLRLSTGYTETLRRGYAVVRGDGEVVTTAAAARGKAGLEIEFQDGRLAVAAPRRRGRAAEPPEGQGRLL